MEPEVPERPPTLSEQATDQLQPRSTYPSLDIDYGHYKTLGPNSGRMHSNFLRSVALHMQIGGARFFMQLQNDLRVYHHDRYLNVLANHRPRTQGLLTLSNHQSTLDDPAILASVTPYSIFTDIHTSRWSWCARDMCFRDKFTGWFFLTGKIFPVTRGVGLYQRGVREAEEHLAQGEWVHIFPEGRCIPNPHGIAPLKWGFAKLVADAHRRHQECERVKSVYQAALKELTKMETAAAVTPTTSSPSLSSSPAVALPSSNPASLSSYKISSLAASANAPCALPPIVLPMVHHGMPKVMPFYQRFPKTGHRVRAIFGEPLQFDDLIDWHEKNQHNFRAFDYPAEEDLYIAMTNRVYDRLVALDKELLQITRDEGDVPPVVAAPNQLPLI